MKTILSAMLFMLAPFLRAQELADLFEANRQSVVTIYTQESVNTGTGDARTFASNLGLGSGVLVGEKNLFVLTAAHVVGNAEIIMVEFFDGEAIPASVERISRIADVALVRLDHAPSDPHPAMLGNSDSTRIGEEIFVVGAPMGLPYSLSRGIISGRHSEERLTRDGKILEFFQTDAAINTGNSGGPMFNYKGEVIGIVSSILTRSGGFEGIGFAATSEIATTLLLTRSAKYFGIDALLLPPELARILNVPQESGWLVQHVVKNSPAYLAGVNGGYRAVEYEGEEILLGGDIILSIDDIELSSLESIHRLMDYLDQVESAKTHKINILRGGVLMELFWVSSDINSQ
jgi:serine protease Do